ncbi:hypothetical protein SAMN05216419_10547 [Nitrosomonas cryotolerans]|uniref:hypothetical protein n=1 Tax=Nitrosomonas cryotolerans TaxID=44575 RepID=UPI00048B36DC|nr:hypothetical protein [Nitrosomonas cryotolerans]SFQ06571.1 hypothetical protein SAMN05216419_10547 [Nitrosomonas cryotolerans]
MIIPPKNYPHIRTTNPVESAFAPVRPRTAKTKHCGSRATTLVMVCKLMEMAQKERFRLRSDKRLADVISGIQFVNGIKQTDEQMIKNRWLLDFLYTKFDYNSVFYF